MKFRKVYLFFLIIPFSITSCNKEIKTSFSTYKEFREYQEDNEYQIVGKFNDLWPAKITYEQTSMNKVSVDVDGQKHSYSGFDGYEMKVIHLKTNAGTEAIII